MFYYPNVLQRHTGRFATIWLAATKGIKITRRDYLNVNVYRTCNDIMAFVLVQVPPVQPGLPRPRFSLYLSSQLQYGIIIVFHRQCVILLEEIHQTIEKLLRTEKTTRIDLVESDRALTLPSHLSALEEADGALDPFFGVMDYGLPAPESLPEQWRQVEPSPPRPTAPPEDEITAMPETITLREEEPNAIAEAEFEGGELPEVTGRDGDIIDILMDQEDQFPEEEREVEERELGREGESRELPVSAVSIEQLPVTSSEAEEPMLMLVEEETGIPAEIPAVTPEGRALPSVSLPPEEQPEMEAEREPEREHRLSPSPEAEEVAPRPRRARRQLRFFDEQTQIPHGTLQHQIEDPQINTHPLSQMLIKPPSQRTVPPSELFSNPCTTLPPDILSLWRRATVVSALPPVRLQAEEREATVEPEPREIEEDEISSREVPREEPTLPSTEVSAPSELWLEASDRDSSRSALAESAGSPIFEPLPPLVSISEERQVSPEKRVTGEILPEQVALPLEQEGYMTFHCLLPPLADRRTVSSVFYSLLEMLSDRKLCAHQAEPYATITITPGELYK